jgi:hypothetical protein
VRKKSNKLACLSERCLVASKLLCCSCVKYKEENAQKAEVSPPLGLQADL